VRLLLGSVSRDVVDDIKLCAVAEEPDDFEDVYEAFLTDGLELPLELPPDAASHVLELPPDAASHVPGRTPRTA
jgi:hypothetical protein